MEKYTLKINPMKINLFRRKGIFFIPISVIGWLFFLIAIAYSVYLFIDIDNRSHSVSDTLINFVFNALIIAIIYSLIAFFTSKREK